MLISADMFLGMADKPYILFMCVCVWGGGGGGEHYVLGPSLCSKKQFRVPTSPSRPPRTHTPLGFCDSQIVIVTNVVVVSKDGIKRVVGIKQTEEKCK